MSTFSLIRGTSIVAALTACSRVLGFLRDVIIASVFGASLVTDAFFVAFRLPNLLRSLVAEGALTSAFVPVFSHALEEDDAIARRTFRAMTGVLLSVTVVLSFLGIIFADNLISLFAPGFAGTTELYSLAVSLTRWMFPYIVFISLIALINGALNSKNIFGAAPFAQIIMNLCLAAGGILAIFFIPEEGIFILAGSVVIGGILQVLAQLPFLKRAQLTLLPARPLLTKETRQILLLMLPAIVGAAAYQISVLLNTVLASLLITGAVSWLFFADRVSQLPVGIFTVSLGSVLLPGLSRAAAQQDSDSFGKTLIDALRYTSFVMIPLAGYLFCFAEPAVALLFERGSFSNFDTQMTAIALQGVSIGLWGVACNYLCIRGFLAHKNTILPTILGLIGVFCTLIIALLTMGPIAAIDSPIARGLVDIQRFLTSFFPSANTQHFGLALSSGLSSTLIFPLALILLKQKKHLSVPLAPFLVASARLMLVTIATMLLVDYFGLLRITSIYDFISNSLISLTFFISLSFLLRVKELEETYSLIRRKVYRG